MSEQLRLDGINDRNLHHRLFSVDRLRAQKNDEILDKQGKPAFSTRQTHPLATGLLPRVCILGAKLQVHAFP